MLLESITLNNFRQYKGTQTIRFSTDPEKNVTVILGENTNGKTTLVQSFIWCLYNKTEFKDKDILNAEVNNDLLSKPSGSAETASVIVRLNHNDTNYVIERRETSRVSQYRKVTKENSFKVCSVDQMGNATPIDPSEAGNVIQSILPENLSDYFFFWGERIEKLSERKELTQAVKQFLGLDTMAIAIKHLDMVIRTIIADNKGGPVDDEIEKLRANIRRLENENKKFEKEKQSLEENQKYYENEAEKLFKELTTSENTQLQQRQNEFKNKSNRLENAKNELEKARDNLLKHFSDSKNFTYFLSDKLEKKAVEILKNNPEPVVGWNYIDLNAINEIIKRGKCICGNEFCEGSEVYNYLIKQRDLVAPNVVGGVINSFIEQAERRGPSNDNYYQSIHQDYKKIQELNDEIVDLEYEVNSLKKLITGKSDLKRINKKYEDALQEAKESAKKLAVLSSKKEKNEQEISRNNNSIKSLMNKNAKFIKQQKQMAYAEQVRDRFKEEYKKNERTLKSKLQDYVNQNFDEVYSGDRRIEIDDKYNAVAWNRVGDSWIKSETSPGLETVKNFAFISGLVQCAKEKIIGDEGEEEANPNTYPLVLDAPFSQADERHVPAISELISKNAEQIILVVMKKDWNYAEKVLRDKVGQFYKLKKVTETHTVFDEEDEAA